MNKTFKTLFLLILFISSGQIHSQQNASSDYNIKGKIKKVSCDSYLAEMTSQGLIRTKKGWEETEKNDKTIEFNEKGYVVNVSYFNEHSKIVRTENYDYKSNNLIKSESKYQKSYYHYDNNNRLKWVKTFDRTPDIISASSVKEIDGKEKLIIEYTYDSDGRIKEKVEHNKTKNTQSTTLYFYNENNLLIKKETIHSDDYKDWYLYEYDSNENIINKKWFDSDEGMLENETNFYSETRLTSSIWENYADGELEGKVIYKYENDNEIEIIEYDILENSQIKWEYKYEYDSMNNWTKKIAHTFKDEYYIVYRKLEYY